MWAWSYELWSVVGSIVGVFAALAGCAVGFFTVGGLAYLTAVKFWRWVEEMLTEDGEREVERE